MGRVGTRNTHAAVSLVPRGFALLHARLQVKEYRAKGANPFICFSGDAYNPSLMSTITLGKQMVPILNEIGVNVSCVGVGGLM